MEVNSLHHLIVWRLAAIDWSISDSSSSTLWFLASIDCRSRALMLWNYKENSTCHKITFQYKPFNNCKQNPKWWCDHSNETSSTVLSHRTTCLESSSNFWVCGWNPMVLPFKSNLFSSILTRCYTFSAYSCSSNFWVRGWYTTVWLFKWNLLFTWSYSFSV